MMSDKDSTKDWFDQVAYVADMRPSEVARLTGLPRWLVVNWLKWRFDRSKPYKACWLDLVELVVVAAFRPAVGHPRDYGLALRYAKGLHDALALQHGTPYPFATEGLPVRDDHAFRDAASAAVAAFDYEDGKVRKWYPRGRDNRVSLDILCGFGHPSIKGIYTCVLADRMRADKDLDFVADDYGLSTEEVLAALEFEGVTVRPGCEVATGEDG